MITDKGEKGIKTIVAKPFFPLLSLLYFNAYVYMTVLK